jgi:type I restriction enzyme S subunit
MIQTKEATVKKYPAYKYSGLEWLGEIPEGWDVLPGLRFITEGKEKNKGMIRDTVLSLSYGNIRVREKEELTGLVPESFETYQLVNKGDLIFRPTDLQNDKVSLRSSISNFDGIITSAYLNLRIKDKASSKFYHYLFRAIDNNKVIYGLGSGLRQNISYLDFRRFDFPFPSLTEQTAIANFLDNKTTKIDTAIAQKEKMIALLKERKQIIIQNAVTKGLDPHVKLKDCGVEWIGEIPEHWEVLNFRYLIEILTDYTANGSFGDLAKNVTYLDQPSYSRLIRLTDLRKGLENQGVYLDKKSHKYLSKSELFGGELLMANVGAYAGLAWIMPEISKPASLAPNMFLIKPMQKLVSSEYLATLINSEVYWNYITVIAQSAAQPKLNKDNIREIKMVLPPKKEQELISKHIEYHSNKFGQLIALQQTQIEKLKEYKASLIDSAVTGKIKVS